MNRTKLFDLHIEVGANGLLHYARTVLSALEFEQYNTEMDDAIFMLLADLKVNQVFNSLRRDPKISSFPMITTPSTKQKLFDLHIEVSENSNKTFYAKTEFVNPPMIRELPQSLEINIAISDLVMELEAQGILIQLMNQPSMSFFPFGASPSSSPSTVGTTTSSGVGTKKKNVPLRLPSDIGNEISHPACQNVCTSFEHFLDKKCHAICPWRF